MRQLFTQAFLRSVILPYNSLYTQAVAYATYFELGEPVQQVVFIHCLSLTFHAVLAQSILDTTIMRRRQDTWDRLQAEMSSKRIKAADGMSGARKNLLRMKSSSRDQHQNRTRNKHTGLCSQGNLSTSNLSLNNLKKA